MFNIELLRQAFESDINDDFILIAMSVGFVFIYSFFFLGVCSPIQCRASLTMCGLFSVLLAYMTGMSMGFYYGLNVAGVHNLLPFLLIGIGVDDMFVIVNAVDQTSDKLPLEQRIKIGFAHAGPSITITSFTNAVAFMVGTITSLQALESFCMFAAACIIMLYFTVLTIFSSCFIWDLRRQKRKGRDCCGLCCCKENSLCCCRGYFLPKRAKITAGLMDEHGNKIDLNKKAA